MGFASCRLRFQNVSKLPKKIPFLGQCWCLVFPWRGPFALEAFWIMNKHVSSFVPTDVVDQVNVHLSACLPTVANV